MKRFVFSLAVIASLCVTPVLATESNSTFMTTEQQQGSVVNAIYVGQGGINHLLIRTSGGYVVAYCSGTDYNGRQVWTDIQPAPIRRNSGGSVSSDRNVNYAIASKSNTAYVAGVQIYF